jgi:hypothetical protein
MSIHGLYNIEGGERGGGVNPNLVTLGLDNTGSSNPSRYAVPPHVGPALSKLGQWPKDHTIKGHIFCAFYDIYDIFEVKISNLHYTGRVLKFCDNHVVYFRCCVLFAAGLSSVESIMLCQYLLQELSFSVTRVVNLTSPFFHHTFGDKGLLPMFIGSQRSPHCQRWHL